MQAPRRGLVVVDLDVNLVRARVNTRAKVHSVAEARALVICMEQAVHVGRRDSGPMVAVRCNRGAGTGYVSWLRREAELGKVHEVQIRCKQVGSP